MTTDTTARTDTDELIAALEHMRTTASLVARTLRDYQILPGCAGLLEQAIDATDWVSDHPPATPPRWSTLDCTILED